jgi:beta-N-acetylhexosaminidase
LSSIHKAAGAEPPVRACLFGLSGLILTADERAFFASSQPLGFILFARNIESPDQVCALTAALRECVGRADAPVLIDQEGGRVARLKPPHWHHLPPAAAIAGLPPEEAQEAAWLAGRIIAADLSPLGIDVACAPVLDVLQPDLATDVIGDRSYGSDPAAVSALGRAMAEGLLAGGVLSVAKHIPGHGRAQVDSHFALPRVDAPRGLLESTDFMPFRALRDLPFGMTAHIVYPAIDPDLPATQSPRVVEEIIRGCIGFDGFLLSDDVCMAALEGPVGARAAKALAAGCDAVLHCNGDLAEMQAVAAMSPALTGKPLARWQRIKRPAPQSFDVGEGAARLAALLPQA